MSTSQRSAEHLQRPLRASAPLARLLTGRSGQELLLTRGEAVKRVWAYAKENNLQVWYYTVAGHVHDGMPVRRFALPLCVLMGPVAHQQCLVVNISRAGLRDSGAAHAAQALALVRTG